MGLWLWSVKNVVQAQTEEGNRMIDCEKGNLSV